MDEIVLPASKDIGGLTEGTVKELTENILQVRIQCIEVSIKCCMLRY